MKIKIMDDFVHEYEDVTRGEVYEVVEECLVDYVIIDDQFDKNAILKEHCEIVELKEGSVKDFKVGDRVKINGSNMVKLEEWSIEHKANSTGVVKKCGERDYIVLTDDDDRKWFVPEQLLYKIPETTSDTIEEVQRPPSLQQIVRFSQNNRGFSIEFDAGKITLADWSTDPNATFYRPKTLEELGELMELLEKINEFRDETN